METINLSRRDLLKLPNKIPTYVEKFDCSYNKLSSLSGSPKSVHDFCCEFNSLLTLKGGPTNAEFFYCGGNKLVNLDGAPSKVGSIFDCNFNKLTSLLGVPKFIGFSLSFGFNSFLLDISDVWNSEIRTIFYVLNRDMALLPMVKFDCYNGAHPIINGIMDKNRGSSKQNIIDCQYDLIKNDYSDNAKWKP